MNILRVVSLIGVFLVLMIGLVLAEVSQKEQRGSYLVITGNVSSIKARMLVVDDQPYPVSKFARVFNADERGQEMPLHTVVSIGRVDRARLYILGGKVEKIIVLKNL